MIITGWLRRKYWKQRPEKQRKGERPRNKQIEKICREKGEILNEMKTMFRKAGRDGWKNEIKNSNVEQKEAEEEEKITYESMLRFTKFHWSSSKIFIIILSYVIPI